MYQRASLFSNVKMGDLLEIVEKLQDTHEAVVRLERSITAKGQPPPSMVAMLTSLQDRQHRLEEQFAQASHGEYLDVCRYELFPQAAELPTLAAVSKTLLDFQSLFTQVYDAVSKGVPRATAKVSAEVTAETAFTFAYTFSGSMGIVLTMPNERLLLGETTLDQAMRKVFDMAKSTTPENVAAHAREVGVAPIRTMYQWASDQLFSGVTSRIEWRRQEEVRSELQIQQPELEELRRAIEATSEQVVNEFIVIGELRGWDVDSRTFHIRTDAEDIRGRMSDEVATRYTAAETVEVPKIYTATIQTVTVISFAYDKETVTHYLLALED